MDEISAGALTGATLVDANNERNAVPSDRYFAFANTVRFGHAMRKLFRQLAERLGIILPKDMLADDGNAEPLAKRFKRLRRRQHAGP
jgi:hypothetical protein